MHSKETQKQPMQRSEQHSPVRATHIATLLCKTRMHELLSVPAPVLSLHKAVLPGDRQWWHTFGKE